MKKRTGVSIGIAVVIVSVIVGIASLPDEVLIKSPSIDTSQNPSGEETQGKVIEVKIRDGVGSRDK